MNKVGMHTPEIIRDIAWTRIREAEYLCKANFLEGSFYLAGYSVELMLKAKICETFGIRNLFAEGDIFTDPQERQNIKISEIRKAVKIHNLYQLLVYSGLKLKYDREKSVNQSIFIASSLLFNKWDESCRYFPIGTFKTKYEILPLIENLLDENNGLLRWIEIN